MTTGLVEYGQDEFDKASVGFSFAAMGFLIEEHDGYPQLPQIIITVGNLAERFCVSERDVKVFHVTFLYVL